MDDLSDDSARKGGLPTTGAKDAESRGSVGSVSGRIGPDGVMEARTSVGGVQRVTWTRPRADPPCHSASGTVARSPQRLPPLRAPPAQGA